MEYVTVNCKRVRGLGNVLAPSISDDYITHFCRIESEKEDIESFNHTVLTLKSYFENIGYYLLNVLGVDQLIKNLSYNENSMTVSYDILNVSESMTMRDMSGVIKDIYIEDDVVKYSTYSTSSDLNKPIFNMADLNNLIGCLTKIYMDGDIWKYEKITEVVK